jgi:hypothetical protein
MLPNGPATRLCGQSSFQEDAYVTEQTDKAATKSETEEKSAVDGPRFKTGVAVGIGSAAIVAALMYARSGRAKKK